MGVSSVSLLAAHWSLGLYLGGLLFVALLAPPLVSMGESLLGSIGVLLGLSAGVGSIWLMGAIRRDITYPQWAQGELLLLSLAWASGGLAAGLNRLGLKPIPAAALASAGALVWLTWPIWLTPWLGGTHIAGIVRLLVFAHPAMALNGVLVDLGVWSERTLAYHLTNLGQDIEYQLPATPWNAIEMHGCVGLALLAISRLPMKARHAMEPLRPGAEKVAIPG